MARRLKTGTTLAAPDTPKKRGRPPAPKPDVSNVSADTKTEIIRDAVAAKAKVDTANGEYRAVLKRAKGLGMEPGDITWYIQARKRDIQDIDRETRRRNEIARLMGLPIGTQLGMFDDGQTVGATVERDKTRDEKITTIGEAGHAGYEAARSGQSLDDNPYDNDPNSPLARAWAERFRQSQADMEDELSRGVGKRAALAGVEQAAAH